MQQVAINLVELKNLYNTAVKEGKETFSYKGHEFVVGYAKYLIQYLESKSKGGN